jgi:hypothetical protein
MQFVDGLSLHVGWLDVSDASAEMTKELSRVLEPKALPGFIEQESVTVAPADVALAASHLSRYVRSEAEKAG